MHIGLDAGGSTTELLARTLPSAEDIHLYGPGANPNRIGPEEATRVLADLIREAQHRCPRAALAAVCAGVAGAGSDDTQRELTSRLRSVLRSDAVPIHVVHDAAIALEAAFGAESGFIVVAGTGSVVFARTREGEVRHVGGWGYEIGDEGSGYALGRAGLRAVAHALDGGPETCLEALLAAQHDLTTREEIIRTVYHTPWHHQELAALVLEAAQKEDGVAVAILEEQTRLLAQQVAWLAARCPTAEPRVALFGGLTNSAVYVEALRHALKHHLPDWSVDPSPAPPVAGALRLALRATTP